MVQKPDRGARAVGPGVIEAFYFGLDQVRMEDYAYLCKLDLDLDLPARLLRGPDGADGGRPADRHLLGQALLPRCGGRLISEKCGDEMSVGMTKFYRTELLRQIGGFVREVMWDAIDCHKARQMGWIAVSLGRPRAAVRALRPMGSSQKSIHVGRRRHGFGQYYMGSDPLYFAATALFRMAHPPYVTGGLSMLAGYFGAWARRAPQHDDPELRAFVRAYQRRALRVGKARAVAEIEAERAATLEKV